MADWNFGGEEGFYLLNNLSGENRWEEGNSLLSAYNTKLFLVKPTVFPNGTQTISTPKQTLAENNIYFLKGRPYWHPLGGVNKNLKINISQR